MADKESALSGTQRAAILLMSLGEKHAASILRHMDPREVHKVGTAMSSLGNITGEQVEKVLSEFLDSAQSKNSMSIGKDEYVSKVLQQALGAERAEGMINRVLEGRNVKGLETLKWMGPETIVEVVRDEHPQIISIVLSQLDADQAASVLAGLDDEVRTDVLLRVARMEEIHPAALEELDRVLARQVGERSVVKPPRIGGSKKVADILNCLDTAAESALTKRLVELDEVLGQEIQELMFVFDNLKDVDGRGIQALLREVSGDVLVIALKGADDVLKDKIFSNMSKRAAEMMRDDMETKGPVKLSEVKEAQKEILQVAQRMIEAGEIMIGGKGGEEYV